MPAHCKDGIPDPDNPATPESANAIAGDPFLFIAIRSITRANHGNKFWLKCNVAHQVGYGDAARTVQNNLALEMSAGFYANHCLPGGELTDYGRGCVKTLVERLIKQERDGHGGVTRVPDSKEKELRIVEWVAEDPHAEVEDDVEK